MAIGYLLFISVDTTKAYSEREREGERAEPWSLPAVRQKKIVSYSGHRGSAERLLNRGKYMESMGLNVIK